ncbi:hypothetical protein BJX64DRAFT_275907 [Aspergillus heterothallicus]
MTDHSLDCVYRNVGSSRNHTSAGRRQPQLREVQRSRPSPWPSVNLNITPYSGPSHSPDHSAPDSAVRIASMTVSTQILPHRRRQGIRMNAISPGLGDSASRDGLSGVNIHTKGTEFYSTSSNFAFLQNLATTKLHSGLAAGIDPGMNNAPSNKSQLPIVNVLYDPRYPTQSLPQLTTDENAYQARNSPRNMPPNLATGNSPLSIMNEMPDEARIEVEKIFISSLFSNKHYTQPMLSKHSFKQRCEQQAFVTTKRVSFCNGMSRFSGLYFCDRIIGPLLQYPAAPALDLADFYFGSVFCQNALRPHSCYMYSGMAVRTAVAVGLASGISSLPPVIRTEGIRTWWCIYSHEVPDSVKDLSYYQVQLPEIQAIFLRYRSKAEGPDTAMIPAMLLYHSPKHSTAEKSRMLGTLDKKLLPWKSTLPDNLNVEANTLNDPEWVFKQRLLTIVGFYNTRILINRPFLTASMSTTGSSLLPHLHLCLSAAQSTIQMQYEAFLHRIYIRTWWYNTTCALYASMMLLHVILSGYSDIRDQELLADVEKSLDIFESMNNIVVARRCLEMIREVLRVARSCTTRRRIQLNTLGAPASGSALSGEPSNSNPHTFGMEIASINPNDDGNFFFSLFNQDSQLDTRANMLADLVDPTILENFAFGNGWNDFSSFLNIEQQGEFSMNRPARRPYKRT